MTEASSSDLPVVLHLLPTLSPGGGEFSLLRNIGQFDDSLFEHIIVYAHPPSVLAGEFEKTGAQVYCLDPEGKQGFLRRVFKLRGLIRDKRVGLIHTTNAEADKLGAIAGLLTRVPVFATLNTTAYTDDWLVNNPSLNRWKLRYMKLSRKVVLRLFVRRYNAVSTFVKESFKNSLGLPPGKIDVTFRGVDLATFRRRSDQKRSVEQGGVGPRLITVGRLVGEKGQQYIIDAMPAIRREFPGARLQIAGDGYLAQTLKDRVRDHGLEGAVEFLGYRSDIPELLAAADIFLLPSIIEGCPNALLEAMAVGLPCIASDSGPVPEIITHGRDGVLTRPRDTDAITEAVIGVAGDPECAARLGNAAAERIASAFTIQTAVGALERFYAHALEVEAPSREPSAEVTTEN